jgi:HEAT repeat protein
LKEWEMLSRRWTAQRTLAMLLAIGMASLAVAADNEPTYRGRTVSQWAARIGMREDDIGDRAVRAFQELGPKAACAVPTLVHTLVWEPDQNEAGGKVRDRAIDALKAIGPDAVPALRAVLKRGPLPPEGTERYNAILFLIEALGECDAGSKDTIADLIEVLKSTPRVGGGLGRDEEIREQAARALAKSGPGAIPGLLAVLRDKEHEAAHIYARSGVEGLRRWRPAEKGRFPPETKVAVSQLVELLQERPTLLHSVHLAHLSWSAPSLLAKLGPDAKAAVPALMDALSSKQSALRLSAVYALGEIGPDAKMVPALTDLLNDDEAHVRAAAATVLGKIGPEAKAAVPALVTTLKDLDAEVREAAAGALGLIGPEAKSAVTGLVELLKDKEGKVRFAAADALLRLGERRAEAEVVLAALIRDPKSDLGVTWQISRPKSAPELFPSIAELRKALTDKDETVRSWARGMLGMRGALEPREKAEAAIKWMDEDKVSRGVPLSYDPKKRYVDGPGSVGKALVRMGPAVVPVMLDALPHYGHPERIALVLVWIDPGPKTVALLTKCLEDKMSNERVQAGCLRGLAEIGPEAKTALPTVLAILRGPRTSRELRREAAKALAEIAPDDKAVIAALAEAVKGPADDDGLRGLVLVGPPAIPVLLDMFHNKDGWKGGDLEGVGISSRSRMAAESLGEIGPAAVPALVEALRDKDAQKRNAVVRALGRIGPPARAAVPVLLEVIKSDGPIPAGMALKRIDSEAANKAGVR